MKRLMAILVVLILLLISLSAMAEGNLLNNGGFEEFTKNGDPQEWYSTAYRNQTGYSTLTITDETAHSGSYCAMIENTGSNDARFLCDVQVEPNQLYHLSVYVKVDQPIEGGNGANLALEDFICTSDCILEVTDGWQLLEWYGQTGENQDWLTFGVRLGGYGRESIGKAYFDDVTLTRVEQLPVGVNAQLWFQEKSNAEEIQEEEEGGNATVQEKLLPFTLCAAAFLLVFLLLRKGSFLTDPAYRIVLGIMMILAFALRVALAMSCQGYQVDIGCFKAWSLRMATVGPSGFYAEDYFCDYPPGAMLLLYPVGLLLKRFGESEALCLLFVKLLPILADMASALLLWYWAWIKKRPAAGFLLSGLILFNPAVLVTGAAWGQMDSVLALLLILCAFFAVEKKWHIAIPVYVLSILIKPQALLVGPVALVWLLVSLLRSEKTERKRLLGKSGIGAALALLAALLIVAPFAVGKEHPLSWLIGIYGETLGSYDYAVLNAANLYYLFGANWKTMGETVPLLMKILLTVGSLTIAAALFLKNRFSFRKAGSYNRTAGASSPREENKPNGRRGFRLLPHPVLVKNNQPRSTRDLCFAGLFAALFIFLGVLIICPVSYGVLGYGLLVFVYLFAILYVLLEKDSHGLPFALALVLTGLFVFAVKMHERYLFPALLLYLLAYLTTGDRRMIRLCAGFSITTFLNTAIILTNSILLGSAYGHLTDSTSLLNTLLCLANLSLAIYAGFVAVDGLKRCELSLLWKSDPKRKKARQAERICQILRPSSPRLSLRAVDIVIMTGVTLAYSLLCFTNLGSTVAPQTAYVSSSADEEVVLALQENTEFSVLYYGGVSYNDFAIAVSSDGETWSDDIPCQMNEGVCYRWLYALQSTQDEDGISYASGSADTILWFQGQYIKLKPQSAALNLWEIVARNRQGENLKLTLVSQSGNLSRKVSDQYPAIHLVDEPDTCTGEPSWYNGTYFDEIYYARTAWEFTQGQSIYETSHPPLGKLFMAASVKLFGMTPFAWRFPGAVLGVLMLPLMYLLAYQLLHKRSAAVGAMGAMALGLMHFTQTRITTIDTYPVFFIMLSFFFMYRYLQSDFFAFSDEDHPKALDRCFFRGLLPLLGSGVSMGLAIASKWIGLYAAVGLAILFFCCLIRRVLQYSALANQMDEESKTKRLQAAAVHTPKRVLFTLLFCVLFFILIPVLIYYASYIPYFVSSGGITLSKLIATQINMFNYHSSKGLGMDHPFYSPWWQWPLLMKPMWFVQDAYEPAGYASTILVFGNQWVFYLGALAMIGVLASLVIRRAKASSLTQCIPEIRLPFVLLISFAVQYVPWMLVPRGTYMYHYFASAPFLILATVWCISQLKTSKARWIVTAVYLAGALVFFAVFFPYASGLLTETRVLDQIRSLYALMKNLPGCSSYFNLWY